MLRHVMQYRRVIAALMLVLQGLMALGFGPRAVCERPDGFRSVSSMLTPCCCDTGESLCCGEEGVRSADGDVALAPGTSCGCTDTLVAAEPFLGERDGGRVAVPPPVLIEHGLIPFFVLLSDGVAAAGRLPMPPAAGPPGGPHCSHLDSVVLRL